MKKNIFIAAADNLSRSKSYEYADEFGFEIAGESGYIDDASDCICKGNINMVICSQRLYDGDAKTLYHKLPRHIKDKCDICIISPSVNGTYKLKQIPHTVLHQGYSDVEKLLDYVCIPRHLKGYPPVKAALEIALATPDAMSEMFKKIIEPIAKAYGENTKTVEYNMRSARDYSIKLCSADVMREVFGYFPDNKSISLSIFLSKLVEYILKTR